MGHINYANTDYIMVCGCLFHLLWVARVYFLYLYIWNTFLFKPITGLQPWHQVRYTVIPKLGVIYGEDVEAILSY